MGLFKLVQLLLIFIFMIGRITTKAILSLSARTGIVSNFGVLNNINFAFALVK